jgi:dethiobiotin synthetase
MSPISSDATCLDLIVELASPAVLVTGTYLGALSHTLTALAALRGRRVALRAIVVSESDDGVGLVETVDSLREFGGADLPIYSLPRLAGGPEARWRAAPALVGICEPHHE